jgi:hypothetical protein
VENYDSMPRRCPFLKVIVLLALTPCLWAQDGLHGALKSANASELLPSSFGSKLVAAELVAADFDDDQKPDGALLFDAGAISGQKMYRIELHLSAGENRNLMFAANDPALRVSALDVNQDGIPDLIVEQVFTHKRLQVWLNDGHGRFRQARAEDFPAPSDAPFRWHALFDGQASPAVSLPSRFENHQTVRLIEVLRFDSSSSRWRVLPQPLDADESTVTALSPRAPPAILPLTSHN